MGAVIAPPGSSGSPGTDGEQALFMAARRRRRRRWVAGIATVVVAATLVAVAAVTWLPRAFGQGAGGSAVGGAAVTGHSAAWQARISYRVVTAGVLEAYGTRDVRYSGRNWDSTSFQLMTARGPSPTQVTAVVERSVNGKVYYYWRVNGRMRWVAQPFPEIGLKVSDPRTLLSKLKQFTTFRAAGYQEIGGTRMTVLRATGPAGLTRRALLPAVYTSGQAVTALTVWAGRQGVVRRLAFTFTAPGTIALAKPTSKAALRRYQRAEDVLPRLKQEGKRITPKRLHSALRLQLAALQRAYPVRRGAQLTTTTITFVAIGQPDRITAPADALSYRAYVRLTGHR